MSRRNQDDVCSGCIFWKMTNWNGASPPSKSFIPLWGECRNSAPISMLNDITEDQAKLKKDFRSPQEAIWPVTKAEDWCGDYDRDYNEENDYGD